MRATLRSMSQNDEERILLAARKLRTREGPGFALAQLARPSGLSRATLYRRLNANPALAKEIAQLRSDGARTARDEFLQAAIVLLTEQGITELTMEAVAARAGLSLATLYRTFTDRDTLVREVLRSALPAEPLRQILRRDAPTVEVLEAFVEALLQRIREHPFILRFLLLRSPTDIQELQRLRHAEERMSTALVAFFDRNRNQFCTVPAKQLAASLMGQVLGVWMFHRSHEGFACPTAAAIVQLFLNGVSRQPIERSNP